jgi:hypothetical protein
MYANYMIGATLATVKVPATAALGSSRTDPGLQATHGTEIGKDSTKLTVHAVGLSVAKSLWVCNHKGIK